MHEAVAGSAGERKAAAADGSRRGQVALPPAWQHLLTARLAATPAPAFPPPRESLGSLGFFLDLCTEGPVAELEAAPVLLRLEDDSLQAEALDPAAALPASLDDAERGLLAALSGRDGSVRKGRTYLRIAGPGADELLAAILVGARCFLGGTAGFWLQPGVEKPLRWRWQAEPDGAQRLLPDLPRSLQLLRVERAWYLDMENATLGMLAHALPADLVLALPPLEPEHARAVAGLLAAPPLAGLLPAPTEFSAPQPLDRVPRYHLTLQALTRHPRLAAGMPPLAYATLAFDYGGVWLTGREGGNEVRRARGNRLVLVRRHRAEELAAQERLEHAGLVPAVDCEGLPWELTEILPEGAWLFPGAGHSGALEVNTPARWMTMRRKLEPEGFAIDYAPSFPFEVLPEVPAWYVRARPARNRRSYALEIGVRVDGTEFDLLPAVVAAVAEGQLSLTAAANEPADATWHAPIDERRRVIVRLAELRTLLQPIIEYLRRPGRQVRLPWGQAGRLEELAAVLPEAGTLEAPRQLLGMVRRLREAARTAEDVAPPGFVGTLRDYQRQGLRWLNMLAEAGLGGVLADDMGLGKTVQLLAHVLSLKAPGALKDPVLVVAPTSVLPNWEAEIARYAPGLRCLLVHGPQRAARLENLAGHDIVLTSYALLPRDLDAYKHRNFALLVLDEAQQVKNPRTLARRAARALRAARRVCLTGTPLENHLGELWSQLDLAVPGLLGSERNFRVHYRIPIERHEDAACRERLQQRIAPFLLRRTKADVARELPPKTEITRSVVLEGPQRALYDELRESLYDSLRETIAAQGIERSGIVVLDALLKLRQICCDPRLLKDTGKRRGMRSAKFEALMEMLVELIAEDRRILLFSQFTSMLALIAAELRERRIAYVELTGQTRDRTAPVEAFQEGKVSLFLLSLKAGGVGLNLTAADTVIHYDPWWNPAAEDQASDRAHRIGQDKPVFVYRLICVDTVEERIEALKARKAELAEAMLADGGSRDHLAFTEEDLESLFGAD